MHIAPSEDANALDVETEVSIRLSVDDPRAAAALRATPDTPPDSAALRVVGSGLGAFEDRFLPRSMIAGDETTVVVHSLSNGVISGKSTTAQTLFPGNEQAVGPFLFAWEDHRDRVSVVVDEAATETPQLTVAMNAEEVGLHSFEPTPSSLARNGDTTQASWAFAARKAEPVAASMSLPAPIEWTAAVFESGWGGALRIIRLLIASLFAPVALLILSREPRGAGWRQDERGRFAQRALVVTVFASLLFLASAGVELLRSQLHPDRAVTWSEIVIFGVVPSAAMFLGAWLLLIAFVQRRVRWMLGLFAALGLVVGTLLLLALEVASHSQPASSWLQRSPWDELLTALTASSMAIVIVVGVGGLAWAATSGLAGRRRERLRRGALAGGAVLALIAFVTALVLGAGERGIIDTTLRMEVEIGLLDALQVGLALILVVALVAAVTILIFRGTVAAATLRDDRVAYPLLVAVFLYFIVGPGGMVGGFPAPVALLGAAAAVIAFGALSRDRLTSLAGRAEALDGSGPVALLDHRDELLERALMIEALERAEGDAHAAQADSEEPVGAVAAYRERVTELRLDRAYLTTGKERPRGSKLRDVTVGLPPGSDVRFAALTWGPEKTWIENGVLALRLGWPIALFPIAYFFVASAEEFQALIEPRSAGDSLVLAASVVREASYWFAAAFVFGCAYSMLPAATGIWKAVQFVLPAFVGFGLAALVPGQIGPASWLFLLFQLLLFTLALGVCFDLKRLHDSDYHWRSLVELYGIRRIRLAVANAVPVVVAVLGILQQFESGDAQGAGERLLETLSSQLGGPEPGE